MIISKLPLLLLLLAIQMACSQYKPLTVSRNTPTHLARAHFVAADGSVLPVRSWWPPYGITPEAIVVALHGFNDYSKAYDYAGRYLSERGVAVIAYDQHGFGNAPERGKWAGAHRYFQDMNTFLDKVKARFGEIPVYLLGESMGGAVAIGGLTEPHPIRVEGVILSAPAVWSRDMMPWYQRVILAMAESTMPALEVTGSGLKVQATDNLEILRGLWRDPLVIKATRVDAIAGVAELMDLAQARASELRLPVLILYGDKDQVIPEKPVQTLLQKLFNEVATRSVRYPDGYHMLLRDLHALIPLQDILAWIHDRQGPLPSGFEQLLPLQVVSPK